MKANLNIIWMLWVAYMALKQRFDAYQAKLNHTIELTWDLLYHPIQWLWGPMLIKNNYIEHTIMFFAWEIQNSVAYKFCWPITNFEH